ncbi:hypothetical protein CLAFUW4_04627 [Fulvia fulva]|uniref:C2H2-type domain-containing protein n=1 Tax=Passalora fulva TaxID=5499 RepID=A0A9Q8LGE9_PASFU|nr:uncharacterized protein CLAFUR5_04587 [Fulvia fulva]KAK4626671.1 hypothetical protein CLAFUR4_04613 [Fulvia fulva]KAK4627846.1 hypothetical protein CLAFUR0_04615 [Fulvia fulva]UJO16148.1 hypothetical protein CLAFUR5_04587 [Fulvia fulva]WPV13483.1 hypothetical protein CLAFUW4_04627 [Fulvia fulva]WPV29170.1 hypothetical protein CLAFUW7_04619 [Fulvia fulva]
MEPRYPSPLHHTYLPGHDDGRLETVAEERADLRLNISHGLFEESDVEPEHGIYLPSPKRQRTGFNCVHCNMAFTEKRALARHKKTDHHRRQLGLPPDRKHACHICGKHFTRGHDLKRHQNEQHADIGGAMEILSGGSEQSSDRSPPVEDYLPMPIPQGLSHGKAIAPPAVMDLGPPGLPPARPLPIPDYSALPEEAEPRRCSETTTQRASEPKHARRSRSMQAIMKQEQTLRDLEGEADAAPTVSSQESVPQLTSGASSDTDMESDRVSELFPPLQSRSTTGDLRLTSMLENKISSYGREVDSWQPVMCAMCGNAFEDDAEELVKHLRRHLDNFKGKHRCKECKIDFIHAEDLERHQQSVIADGTCGFNFPHRCTGHHPPSSGVNAGQLTDFDRVRLCVRLQEWEQAQLQAYIAEINDLTMARQQRKLTRWSDILRGTSRRSSLCSFAISVNTYATAPCDVSDGKMDLGGLQKRLQQMSLGSAVSRFRRKMNPDQKDARSKTIDKALAKAVKHGDLQKVKSQLTIGGDSKIIHHDQGTFVTVALWGHTYIARRMAEHRVDEDITGKCSVCKMNSSTFNKPANKVRSLLMHSADPNEPGGLHGHPLSTAAWMGKPDIVSLLLEYGGEMRQGGGKFGNALCSAAAEAGYQGQADVIDLLIKEGADVRTVGPEGSALDLARARRNQWSMQVLEATSMQEELELNQRIASCDSVLLTLQAKSNMLDAKDAAAVRHGSNGRESTESSTRARTTSSVYPYW